MLQRRAFFAALAAAALAVGFAGGVFWERHGIPFVRYAKEYSIGIYTGSSPTAVSGGEIPNPILTAADVSDVSERNAAHSAARASASSLSVP